MVVLRNNADFEARYYYREYYEKKNESIPSKEYPRSYPCIMEIEERGGGLAGEYMIHEFTYIPKDVDERSFILGYNAKRNEPV